MGVLLAAVFTTSFFDSLNPSAIAQQMLLQAMVKNKRYIWFFIFGISAANIVLGLAVYYGVTAWVSRLFAKAAELYPVYIAAAMIFCGIACLAVGIRFIVNTVRSGKNGGDEESGVKNPAQLSPLSLFLLGAAFCAVELTSALPYFGFLALLAAYDLVFPLVLGFITVYTFMYALPLILLYFAYNRLNGTAAIKRLESILGRISAYVVPSAVALVGAVFLCYGTYSLI